MSCIIRSRYIQVLNIVLVLFILFVFLQYIFVFVNAFYYYINKAALSCIALPCLETRLACSRHDSTIWFRNNDDLDLLTFIPELPSDRFLLVLNKVDLLPEEQRQMLKLILGCISGLPPVCMMSCHTSDGLQDFLTTLHSRVKTL